MENKELQELFAAKRTVEANRHRQEELAVMISRQATPSSRRLWPLWTASVAAGVAVLLMTLPALFRSETTETKLVAQAETVDDGISSGDSITSISSISSSTSSSSTTSITRTTRTTKTTSNQLTEPIVENPVIVEEEPEPVIEPEPEKPSPPPQRRVHRRTSTRMVSTDNAAPAPRIDYREALAGALCQEESKPITLHTIKIS